MAVLSSSAPPEAANTSSGGTLRSDANNTVASCVLSPNSARNTVTNMASRSFILASRGVAELQRHGALGEGMEQKIFVVVEIVDAKGCGPMAVETVTRPRIH